MKKKKSIVEMTQAEFDSWRAKKRLALKKKMSAMAKGNPKVVLLTASQIKKWWNISQEQLDKVPPAMMVNGKPMYTEFMVDVIATGASVKGALDYNLLGVSRPRSRSKS